MRARLELTTLFSTGQNLVKKCHQIVDLGVFFFMYLTTVSQENCENNFFLNPKRRKFNLKPANNTDYDMYMENLK